MGGIWNGINTCCLCICFPRQLAYMVNVINRSAAHRVQMFCLFQLAILAAASKSMLMYDWDEKLVVGIPLNPDLQLVVAILIAIAVLLILKMCAHVNTSQVEAPKQRRSTRWCCKRKKRESVGSTEYAKAHTEEAEYYAGSTVSEMYTRSEPGEIGGEEEEEYADNEAEQAPSLFVPSTILVSCNQTWKDLAKASVWALSLVPILVIISFKDTGGYTAVAIISIFASQFVVVPLWYVAELSARTMVDQLVNDMRSQDSVRSENATESAVKTSTRTSVKSGIAMCIIVLCISAVEGLMVLDGDLDIYHAMVSYVTFFVWMIISKVDSDLCKELEELHRFSSKSMSGVPRGMCPPPAVLLISGMFDRAEEARVMRMLQNSMSV